MKIAIFGYGKMGKEIEQIAIQRGHTILLKIDVDNSASIAKDDLKQCEVAIEFSTPASAVANMIKCFDAGLPVVVGTTGWYSRLENVKKECEKKKGCLFYASNFSIGVNIFFRLNEQLASMMVPYGNYNVCIEEIHHIHKLDAPSGTGIALAEQIMNRIKTKQKWINSKTDNPSELQIISKREAEVPGTHIVKYHSSIDDIEIMHKAHNRKGFAAGAVMAAEFVKGRQGIFGMNDLLKI